MREKYATDITTYRMKRSASLWLALIEILRGVEQLSERYHK